jgi:hypothetical protein
MPHAPLGRGADIVQRMHGWIGRKDRQPVAVDAVVHRADGTSSAVKLSNISDEGCRIEADDDFRIGEHVEIDIPEYGQLKAQVRWAIAGSAGAKFLADSDA